MIKKGDFIWLIGVCFHAFRLVYDDEVLIFIGFRPGQHPLSRDPFLHNLRIKGEGEVGHQLQASIASGRSPIDLNMFLVRKK